MANVPKEGQVLKYRQTGEFFEVRKIAREFVILHSRDGISQIMTGKKSLFNVFEKVPKMKGPVSPLPDYNGRRSIQSGAGIISSDGSASSVKSETGPPAPGR